jgi:hypothetical protein
VPQYIQMNGTTLKQLFSCPVVAMAVELTLRGHARGMWFRVRNAVQPNHATRESILVYIRLLAIIFLLVAIAGPTLSFAPELGESGPVTCVSTP